MSAAKSGFGSPGGSRGGYDVQAQLQLKEVRSNRPLIHTLFYCNVHTPARRCSRC